MVVLFTTDTHYPTTSHGVARMIDIHIGGLRDAGHEVHLLAKAESDDQPILEKVAPGFSVHRYVSTEGGKGIADLFRVVRSCRQSVRRLLQETHPDVIIYEQPLVAWTVSRMKEVRDTPSLYVYHSSWYEEHLMRNQGNRNPALVRLEAVARRRMERKAISNSTALCVLSEYSKMNLLSVHPSVSQDIYIIPGGVDTDRFSPPENIEKTRKELGLSLDGKVILLTVRGLIPRTGVDNLIKAMSLVKKERKDWHLLIGGKGPMRQGLESLVFELGLTGDITFLGFIPEEQLASYYGVADAFILPTSSMEGFGLVTVESLACGTPVLGTPIGATPEILGELSPDLLFEGSDPKSIAKGILDFLTNRDKYPSRSDCRSESLRYDSRAIARQFSDLVQALSNSGG